MKIKKIKKYAHAIADFENRMKSNPDPKILDEMTNFVIKEDLDWEDLDEIDKYIQKNNLLTF